MFCSNCGKEVVDKDNLFCTFCGSSLNKSPSAFAPVSTMLSQSPFNAEPGTFKHSFSFQKRWGSHNYYGIVAAALFALGAILPLVSVSVLGFAKSFSLLERSGDALIVFCLVAIATGLSWLNKNIGLAVCGFFSIGIALFETQVALKDVLSNPLVSKKAGYYLLLIGALGIIITGIWGALQNKQKEGF